MRKFLINISNYIEYLNKKGIPIPTVRDPKTQRGSVSLTLVAISSGLVIVGCVNKLFGKDLIDMSRSLDTNPGNPDDLKIYSNHAGSNQAWLITPFP